VTEAAGDGEFLLQDPKSHGLRLMHEARGSIEMRPPAYRDAAVFATLYSWVARWMSSLSTSGIRHLAIEGGRRRQDPSRLCTVRPPFASFPQGRAAVRDLDDFIPAVRVADDLCSLEVLSAVDVVAVVMRDDDMSEGFVGDLANRLDEALVCTGAASVSTIVRPLSPIIRPASETLK
jgi:hypothetical protein